MNLIPLISQIPYFTNEWTDWWSNLKTSSTQCEWLSAFESWHSGSRISFLSHCIFCLHYREKKKDCNFEISGMTGNRISNHKKVILKNSALLQKDLWSSPVKYYEKFSKPFRAPGPSLKGSGLVYSHWTLSRHWQITWNWEGQIPPEPTSPLSQEELHYKHILHATIL